MREKKEEKLQAITQLAEQLNYLKEKNRWRGYEIACNIRLASLPFHWYIDCIFFHPDKKILTRKVLKWCVKYFTQIYLPYSWQPYNQIKKTVCDVFSSRQQDAVIMRHFNYSPDKYMVSISNNYSLTILWMIQINSKKIIPHHVLPSEWFPISHYFSQLIDDPTTGKVSFKEINQVTFSSCSPICTVFNNCSLFSLAQVPFSSVRPHSILSRLPPCPPDLGTLYMSNDFIRFCFFLIHFLILLVCFFNLCSHYQGRPPHLIRIPRPHDPQAPMLPRPPPLLQIGTSRPGVTLQVFLCFLLSYVITFNFFLFNFKVLCFSLYWKGNVLLLLIIKSL